MRISATIGLVFGVISSLFLSILSTALLLDNNPQSFFLSFGLTLGAIHYTANSTLLLMNTND